jgi:Peptidase S46
MKILRVVVAAISFIALSSSAVADEGMWLPRQAPEIAAQLKAAGLELAPADLANLKKAPMNAIVSLGGCSAAFLSPDGLVATNHHCVYSSLQYNSKPGQDYMTNGFLAAELGDELPAAPGSRIYVIEDFRDVSAAMTRGVTRKTADRARFDTVEANRKALIAACEKQPNRRCDVRAYYNGQSYFLQQQLEIKDVRLVYAPAGGTGNFGGETDNWQWPRHTGDFGFYRAYVAPDGSSGPYAPENVPYRPKSWLKIAKDGVKSGDFVMVAGFPGVTERWRTAAEAKAYYGEIYPLQQRLLSQFSDLVNDAVAGNAAWSIKYATAIKGADNYKKKLVGQMAGAKTLDLVTRKIVDEDIFRAWINASARRTRQFGPSLTILDKFLAAQMKADLRDQTTNQIARTSLLTAATTLYRWAKEQQKPDAARDPGFQERDRLPTMERLRQIERRYVPEVDRKILSWALTLQRALPESERDLAMLAKLDAIGIDALYARTKLGDTATRLAWLDKSAAAFEASDDPFIQVAVASYADTEARRNYGKDTAGKLQAAWKSAMTARLAYAKLIGKTAYPDANGSLRISYGNVMGKVRAGTVWAPFTTAEGLAEKATGRGDFIAPEKTLKLIKARDYAGYSAPELGTLPVDFMSNLDITNGNSGSSTLNARGEFVGLAFDGTLDGVVSDWLVDTRINRTIHVDSRYMLWTMDKVDGAHRLLREMGVADLPR